MSKNTNDLVCLNVGVISIGYKVIENSLIKLRRQLIALLFTGLTTFVWCFKIYFYETSIALSEKNIVNKNVQFKQVDKNGININTNRLWLMTPVTKQNGL